MLQGVSNQGYATGWLKAGYATGCIKAGICYRLSQSRDMLQGVSKQGYATECEWIMNE